MYSTQQDFIDAFGEKEIIQLTNLYSPAATTINVNNLQRNQQKAFGLINGMIAQCADIAILLPFVSPYPSLLVGYELDVTRYFMDSIKAREDVRKRYEDALTQLTLIGKCRMGLGLGGGASPEVVAVSTGSVRFSEGVGIFTQEALSGF